MQRFLQAEVNGEGIVGVGMRLFRDIDYPVSTLDPLGACFGGDGIVSKLKSALQRENAPED